MDAFDFAEEKPRRQRAPLNLAAIVWNLGTLYFLLMTLALIGLSVLLFLNPQASFNPYPPPTLPPLATIPGPTQTPIRAPTSTFAPDVPTPTFIGAPTGTPPIVPTPTNIGGITITPTNPGGGGSFPFSIQSGSPQYLPSTIYHPELGCNFLGVGGQAFDGNSAAVVGLGVEVKGTLSGTTIELVTLTGAATQYGPGGYEVKLEDEPVASEGSLTIQLKDLEGVPLSAQIPITTFDDCNQNVTLINFSQSP
jgi:hypothetical protein